jgi:uncharacterized protein YdaU (DUF1376 family)
MNTHEHSFSSGCAQAVDSNFSTNSVAHDGHSTESHDAQLRVELERFLSDEPEKLFLYAQWHVGDYILGTQGMSLEHEGAYQRFLMRLYARGKPLPDDDKVMAAIMSLSTRVWKRVKEALVALGKIVVKAGCLTNARFEKERLKRAEQLRKRSLAAQARWHPDRETIAPKEPVAAAVCPKFEPSLPEVSGKLSATESQKPNETGPSADAHAYANQNPITIKSTTLKVRTRDELHALRMRLHEAGGVSINEAHPGFMVLAEPIAWLENGCDLEMDIVPAIQKTVRSKRSGQIAGWAYFRAAVQDARDCRLAPMPEAQPRAAASPQPKYWREVQAEKSARLREALGRSAQKFGLEERVCA